MTWSMQQGASVVDCAAGRCTALHEPPRGTSGYIALDMRPVTAKNRADITARATKIPEWKCGQIGGQNCYGKDEQQEKTASACGKRY